LILEGSEDPYVEMASAVADALVMNGATVEVQKIQANHQLTAADASAEAEWILRSVTEFQTG
jgi:predicted esterase